MKSLIDVHCHTISSGHAYSTVSENINDAVGKGLKYLGISDHACSMPGGPHPFFFHNLHLFPRQVEGTKVLRGIEANIIDYDGNIDVEDGVYRNLDYIIASLHTPCIDYGTVEQNTNTILKVMDNPNVKIIGHLDDDRYPVDYEVIIKKAKEKNILLEVNNSSLNSNSHRKGASENVSTMLRLCKQEGVRVILGSDSHICYTIGLFDNCEKALSDASFPDELVINYHEDQIIEFFNINF